MMTIYNYLLSNILIHTALLNPTKIALVMDNQSYSYQFIYNDCLRFSNYLKSSKVHRGDRIIIQSGNSYLTVIAFWSSLFCEAIPCVIDPEITSLKLKDLLININPVKAVVAQLSDQHCEIYKQCCIGVIADVVGINTAEMTVFSNTEQDIAMIMHTSGSTGGPKGVMLSHRNVIAAIESITAYLMISETDVILSFLPMHFDYGLYQMLLCFCVGATLVLEEKFSFPLIIAHKISKYKVTVLPCVPKVVQLFYLASAQNTFDFSTIKIVTNTGESLSVMHIQKLKMLFKKAKIFSMYGLTECKRCSYVPPDMLEKKSHSIGIPMPNIDMWIQDAKGNRLGPNQEGNLTISGPTVMMGYWNNKEKTDQKIKCDACGKKILISGDRAEVDDEGYFYFRGRSDFIVKHNGIKLNCHDYEKKLSEIAEINRSHLFLTVKNDVEKLLMICVETHLKSDDQFHLKNRIYAQFPSTQKPDHIYFTEQFPSLSSGKLDKTLLEKQTVDFLCI